MSTSVVITIASVFAGFACFSGSFLSYMYKKPPALTWGLLAVSIVLITLIPVTVAVFWAA